MEGADETSINTRHLACTWKAKVKGKESIRKERCKERRGSEKSGEKNTVTPKTNFVIAPERNR